MKFILWNVRGCGGMGKIIVIKKFGKRKEVFDFGII